MLSVSAPAAVLPAPDASLADRFLQAQREPQGPQPPPHSQPPLAAGGTAGTAALHAEAAACSASLCAGERVGGAAVQVGRSRVAPASSLPEEARDIVADGFWRAARERQRLRKGLPPAPRIDCFPRSWFRHGFALDETAADLWRALWTTAAQALEVLETPASVMGQSGARHTLLVGHFARLAALYSQLERWQGKGLALTLLEQALELLY